MARLTDETAGPPFPRVSAWAAENQLSRGQVVVHEKSHEITATPELLRLLEISGAIVTMEATGCQEGMSHPQIRQGDGDYVLAVQQNQPTLPVPASEQGDRA